LQALESPDKTGLFSFLELDLQHSLLHKHV
jgi:hypothetical protein